MQKDEIIQAFVQFLIALNHRIQQSSQLFSGIILAQFLSTVQNTKLKKQQIIKDQSIHGAVLSNLRLISSQIQRYNKQELKNQQYRLDCKINQIYTDFSVKQLKKLLRQCFIIAAKAPNSAYFIQKVLTLPQNMQVVFVNLIKQDGELMPSPSIQKQDKKQQNNHKIDKKQSKNQIQALQLFDRIYDIQLQNEKYLLQVKRLQNQNAQYQEIVTELSNQVESLTQYNNNLKNQLEQTKQSLHKLGMIKLRSTESMNRNQQCRQQLEMLSIKYKEEMELIRIKNQSAKRRFQLRIQELEQQLRIQTQNTNRFKQQNQFYQKQVQNILQKCTEYENQVSQANRTIVQYQKIANQLRQSQAAFKLQINYKNLQIKELKSLIQMNQSNNVENGHYIINQNQSFQRQNGLNKSNKSSKMLTSQISYNNHNTTSTPNLRGSCVLRVEADELRFLRNQIKQLQRQNQKYRETKKKIKQLEYQKNKLIKVLHEYEVSRGQENDILTGCLYQLHNRLIDTSTNNGNSILKRNSCIIKISANDETSL